MISILKIIVGAVLGFFWDRAEAWYQQEVRYQRNKKILIEEVKDVARQSAKEDSGIAIDRESIDDSLVRLERVIVKRQRESDHTRSSGIGKPVFGSVYRRGESGTPTPNPLGAATIPLSDDGSDSDDPESEQPGAERVGSRPDDSMPTA